MFMCYVCFTTLDSAMKNSESSVNDNMNAQIIGTITWSSTEIKNLKN